MRRAFGLNHSFSIAQRRYHGSFPRRQALLRRIAASSIHSQLENPLLRATPTSHQPSAAFQSQLEDPLSRAIATSHHPPAAFHSQLEDPSSAALLSSLKTAPKTPQTITEKIVQRHAVGLAEGKLVRSGDFVTIKPSHVMSHDNTAPIMGKFLSMGATKIKDPKQPVFCMDHDIQNKSEPNLKKYRRIKEFGRQQGVDTYAPGRGIGHQVMSEEGYAWPMTMAVASDSHSNMYGALGCLGTAIVRTDAASIWATGTTWWQIPPIAKLTMTGALPPGVSGKDVIVALCSLFCRDEVLNHAIEFAGSGVESLSIDNRLTIANMTTEFGALTGLFPVDSVLQNWLRYKATEASMFKNQDLPEDKRRFTHPRLEELLSNKLTADKGAKYAKELYLDLSTLVPYVSGPNAVKAATPLHQLASQNIAINRAYLVSCTNSRASDLAAAAQVFRDAAKRNGGKIPKIKDGVHFLIAAASKPEQDAAEAAGDWQVLIDAGAEALSSGCGPCIGLGTGLAQPGEVVISASNRNFPGRMGSRDSQAYLASPEIVAASALNGKISGPRSYKHPEGWNGVVFGEGDGIKEEDRMITADQALEKIIGQIDDLVAASETKLHEDKKESVVEEHDNPVEILPGFPEKITGEVVFCDVDSLSTDGIISGKLTYQDDTTAEQLAEACLYNYDPQFSSIAKAGDILVSGFNTGCGSSREQAATALLAKGIPLVVAGSFGNIFSRNSINNALMGLEVPRLVERLRESFPVPSKQTVTENVIEPSQNKESLDSPPPAPVKQTQQVLTRRTGWMLTWDVRRSKVTIDEGEGKPTWSVKVGELPINVQEIIAKGGLENWVRTTIEAAA